MFFLMDNMEKSQFSMLMANWLILANICSLLTISCTSFRVEGLGFRVQGLGFANALDVGT